jgi:ornithine cyclodeaminase
LWITEAEVVSLIDLRGAIAALELGLRRQAEGLATNMNKTRLAGPDWQLHAIGACISDENLACSKSWVHTPHGATPLLSLWNNQTGKLLAIIEAFALGQMRTGGISGVATRVMAAEDASVFALIGTGKQALAQLAAVAAVRRLKCVRIWGRSADRKAAMAARASDLGYDFAIETPATVEAAVHDAQVVTLVTRAREPIFDASMAAKGAHINAVGAITPEREEFAQDVLRRADLVVADEPRIARALSREFTRYFGDEDWKESDVRPLCTLVKAGFARQPSFDLSLFKAMGMGISDVSMAAEIYRRAREQGVGREFPHPQKAAPRLR